jgi:hypothetical protein
MSNLYALAARAKNALRRAQERKRTAAKALKEKRDKYEKAQRAYDKACKVLDVRVFDLAEAQASLQRARERDRILFVEDNGTIAPVRFT